MRETINSNSIHTYSESDDEALDDEFAEFSPKLQFYKMYRTALTLTSNNQFVLARKVFYDSLSWFHIMFDETFVRRCDLINKKYSSEEYRRQYSPEQLEQLKYIRTVSEFTRLLIDISSKKKIKINQDPSRRVELVAVGYSQIIYYDQMASDFFMKLNQVQRLKNHREVVKFFNHIACWFGGLFDANFLMRGYLIQKTTNQSPETKYRLLVGSFSRLLTRKSIAPSAHAKLVYKPRPSDQIPRSVEDVVKSRYRKEEEPEQEVPTLQVLRNVEWKDILDE